MSLAQITEKIERDARAEADKILARAAEQEAGIIKETADEVEQRGLDKFNFRELKEN